MNIEVTGLSPGYIYQDKTMELEKVRIDAEITARKTEVAREEAKAEEEKAIQKPQKEQLSKFVMSAHDIKELLLMMGSRGNSQTIEKLVELVKLEKEMLEKKMI